MKLQLKQKLPLGGYRLHFKSRAARRLVTGDICEGGSGPSQENIVEICGDVGVCVSGPSQKNTVDIVVVNINVSVM